jgi:hypothetical protein
VVHLGAWEYQTIMLLIGLFDNMKDLTAENK